MKKLLAALVVLTMVLTGCSGGSSTKKTEIALITDSGGINDKSFNQSAWEAAKEYGESNDKGYKYYKPAAFDDAGYKAAISNAVKNGAKVVILPGFKFTKALTEVQKDSKYKDVKFICIDFTPTDAPAKNVFCATYKEEQPGYLAGYAAVKDGYTKLGFMGGISLPSVINFGYGYLQGANDAAKELNKKVDVKFHYTGSFNAEPAIQTKATGWYKSGTEVIFACGGQICTSIFAAAEDTKKMTIGVDSDQKDDSKTVLTSALKNVKQTVSDEIAKVYDDKFEGGAHVLDASGNYVGLSSDYSRFKTFKKADFDKVFESIKSGKKVILSNANDPKAEGNPTKATNLKAALTNVTISYEG